MLFIVEAEVRRETLTDVKSLEITSEWVDQWYGKKEPVNGVKVIYAIGTAKCKKLVMILEANDSWDLAEFFSPILPYNYLEIDPAVDFRKDISKGLKRARAQAQRK